MQRMTRAYTDDRITVLVPADPDRSSSRDVFLQETFEQDEEMRDAALGKAIRERADIIYYGPLPGSQSNFDDVGDFHEKFGLRNATHVEPHPDYVNEDLFKFRMKRMLDELQETQDGWDQNKPEEIFDGLLDLVYLALGTAHHFGFPWQEGWDEVQRANMSKIRTERAEDSPYGHATDILKPADFVPPDIEAVLAKHGWYAG